MPDRGKGRREPAPARPSPEELREVVKNLELLKRMEEAEVLPLEEDEKGGGGEDEED